MNYSALQKKFDKNFLKKLLEDFPIQCNQALELAKKLDLRDFELKAFDKIAIIGMGGSGIGGMLAKELLENKTKIPIFTIPSYNLPSFVNENTLVFAVSYSGNTEETISAVKKAKQRNCSIIAITSGGLLKEECSKTVLLPKGFPPRSALGYLFLPIVVILKKLNLIELNETELFEAISVLEKNRKKIDSIGQSLSKKLFKKIPIVYATDGFGTVAYRWHTQFSENSKQFSHFAVFPELNHNEIVGYKPFENKLAFIILRDKNESNRIKQRIELTEKILKKKSSVVEIFAEGNSSIAKALSLIWIGDFTSYYLALLNKVDPQEVKVIEFLKKSLQEKGFF